MKRLFGLLILNALVIHAVHTATAPGEVGARVGKLLDKPDWLGKPTVNCEPCMASVWGSLVFWTIGPRDWKTFPFYVLALSGFMRLWVKYV